MGIIMKFLSIFLSTIILFSCGGGGTGDNDQPSISIQSQKEWRGIWKSPDQGDGIVIYFEILDNSISRYFSYSTYNCYEEITITNNFSEFIYFTQDSIVYKYPNSDENYELIVSVKDNILTFTDNNLDETFTLERSEIPSSLSLCSDNDEYALIRFEIEFSDLQTSIPVNSTSGVILEINLDIDNSSSVTDNDLLVYINLGSHESYENIEYANLMDLSPTLYLSTTTDGEESLFPLQMQPYIDVDFESNNIFVSLDMSTHAALSQITDNTQFRVSALHYYNDNDETFFYNSDEFEYTSIINTYNAADPLNDYDGNLDTFDIIGVSALIDIPVGTTEVQ